MDQTSNIVGWCWMVFDHCWMVLDGVWSLLDCVGCWSVQTNLTPSNSLGTMRTIMVYYWSQSKKVGRYWMKSLNKVKVHPTPSTKFDCAVQKGQTCCIQQCLIMFDQHVWSVWTDLKSFGFKKSVYDIRILVRCVRKSMRKCSNCWWVLHKYSIDLVMLSCFRNQIVTGIKHAMNNPVPSLPVEDLEQKVGKLKEFSLEI